MRKMYLAAGAAVGLALTLITSAQPVQAHGSPWSCDRTDVIGIPSADNISGGRARLCSTRSGLISQMKIQGSVAGNAYTVWWVYFDDPASCTDGAGNTGPQYCGDLANNWAPPNPRAVFGRMDGAIANHDDERFAGSMRDFLPTPGSQVWLLVFSHGEADYNDRRRLARQLLTPEDPNAGAPHLGIVGGPQGYPVAVAVFTMP